MTEEESEALGARFRAAIQRGFDKLQLARSGWAEIDAVLDDFTKQLEQYRVSALRRGYEGVIMLSVVENQLATFECGDGYPVLLAYHDSRGGRKLVCVCRTELEEGLCSLLEDPTIAGRIRDARRGEP